MRAAAHGAVVDVLHVESDEPRPQRHVLVRVLVEDGTAPPGRGQNDSSGVGKSCFVGFATVQTLLNACRKIRVGSEEGRGSSAPQFLNSFSSSRQQRYINQTSTSQPATGCYRLLQAALGEWWRWQTEEANRILILRPVARFCPPWRIPDLLPERGLDLAASHWLMEM